VVGTIEGNAPSSARQVMDPDAIKSAETRIAEVQAALDDAQQPVA
jgi:hypothetical protein